MEHHAHHDHDSHDMANTTPSDGSCCPDSGTTASSGQHMMHHMMSVCYTRNLFFFFNK